MEDVIRAFERYIQEVLGLSVRVRPWQQTGGLPFYLRDLYGFHEIVLYNMPCVLMVPRKNEEDTPATLRKHLEQIQKKWDGPCIYVRQSVTTYNRKRLIEHRVSFVVPGNQMYLPELAIDLREHFRKIRSEPKPFSPATQVVVIHTLMGDAVNKIMPSMLAKQFGYSAMTMTRSLDELEDARLGEVRQEGRERWLYFTENKRVLWDMARPLMQNPVRRKMWIHGTIGGAENVVEAGLTALSRYSMLGAPQYSVFAVSSEQWKILKQTGLIELPYPDKDAHEMEVWSYNPAFFVKNGVADPFSLFLSLQKIEDERVESALAEMMERVVKW